MRSTGQIVLRASTLAAAIVAASACGANRRAVRPDLQSADVGARIAGARLAVARGDRSAVPNLVDRLDDEDAAVRFAAVIALEKLTGRRLGFGYSDSVERRRAAIALWRRYLREERVAPAEEN